MNVLNSLKNAKELGNKFETVEIAKYDERRSYKKLQSLMNGLDLGRFQFPSNLSPKLYDSYSSYSPNSRVA